MVENALNSRADVEAAAWYARLSNARVSPSDLDAFFAWRKTPDHETAYARVEQLAGLARSLADDPELQAMAEEAANRPRGILVWFAAARRHRRPLAWVSAGVLVAASAIVGVSVFKLTGHAYETAIGERRVVALSDGSSLELNTDSKVRVRFAKGERRLYLDRGQAMFAVAHDATRPFIVTAGDTSVRAIGTRFEVYRAASGVRVILAEGRVQVSEQKAATPPVTLSAGQRLDLAKSPAPTAAPPRPVRIDVAAATGWTQGRLTFQDAPLSQAVAEVNRYSLRKVVLGADTPPDQKINGVFDAGDVDAFASGVSEMLDLKRTRRADGTVELTGAPPG